VVCHGVPSPLPAVLLPPIAAPAGMPAPGARQQSLTPHAPLAELTQPRQHRLGPSVALPVSARSYIARVCWRHSLRHMDTWMPHLSSSPLHHRRTDKNPFSVTSTPAPTIAALAVLCTALAHARFATAPSHHLPLSLLARTRGASTQYTAIKGGDLCISSAPALCPPLVSHHRHTRLCFPPLHQCQAISPHLSPRT
jgi:hypothetical protein